MQGSQEGTPASRLQVLEALLAAGYGLPKYQNVCVHSSMGLRHYEQFNPQTDDPHMQLAADER